MALDPNKKAWKGLSSSQMSNPIGEWQSYPLWVSGANELLFGAEDWYTLGRYVFRVRIQPFEVAPDQSIIEFTVEVIVHASNLRDVIEELETLVASEVIQIPTGGHVKRVSLGKTVSSFGSEDVDYGSYSPLMLVDNPEWA